MKPSLIATSLSALFAMAGVSAAETEQNDEIERIVVKGSKQNKTLMDSDFSVTVFDETMIEDAKLRDFRRIDDLVPNVKFNESGQMSSVFITIRGVESNPFIVNRAAVYIDGIPFRELSNAVLNQIESIEVLRGPQGTLYGANSESGLILVNTKNPGYTTTAEFKTTTQQFSEGSGIEADGFVTGALADNLSGSLIGKIGKHDSNIKNLASSTGESGHLEDTFLQSKLLWEASDKLTVNATAYWLNVDAPGVFDQEYVPLDMTVYNNNYAAMFNSGREISDFTTFNDAPKHSEETEKVLGLSAEYQLADGTLHFAASYRDTLSDAKGLDFDSSAASILAGRDFKDESFKNAEVRYQSSADDKLQYTYGVSMYREKRRRHFSTFIGPGGLDSYIQAPDQFSAGTDLSAFGSVSYSPEFVSDLTISAGLRYEKAKRDTQQEAGLLDLGPGGQIYYQDADLRSNFTQLLPKLSVVYRPNKQSSIFVTSAKGYIPGGFNLAAVRQGFEDENILKYDNETLWSHEIGGRLSLPEYSAYVAGAVFYIESNNWQEIQVLEDADGRPLSSDFIGSDAAIRSYGYEVEASWHYSEQLFFNASFGYVHSRYTDLQTATNENLEGNKVQLVPEYDGNLSVNYEWNNGWFARAEVDFTGEIPLEKYNIANQEAVTTAGLQVGWRNDNWMVRFFGDNLTNERRASGLAFNNLALGKDGTMYAPLDSSRAIGLELQYEY